MATFALGPHSRMLKIVRDKHLEDVFTPQDFIEALRVHEMGYRWQDLRPEGVGVLTWYELYSAYEMDEQDIHQWREEQRAMQRAEELHGTPTQEND